MYKYYKKVTFKRNRLYGYNERLVMENDDNDISDLDLKQRDINLLNIVDEENLSNFTFEGLKRRLKIHPEKLSRILSRLTSQEILKKQNKGYDNENHYRKDDIP
ncbi:MAG: hypothetical protein P8X91_06560, partial [Candidatus Bathyarchaeota archaeon]